MITDNKFTPEEFETAITANPDLLPIAIGTLKDKRGYVIHPKEEFEKTIVPGLEAQTASKITKTHAEKLEADVKKLTGIDKASPDEKYYDYMTRAITEKLKRTGELETELKELREKGNTSAADKDRIKMLEQAIEEKNKELQNKLSDKDKETQTRLGKYEVKTVVAGLRAKFKKDIPETVLKIMEETVTNQVAAMVKFQEDGTPTLIDSKGDVIFNKTTYKPLTIEEQVADLMKDVIDTGKKQTGAGSSGGKAEGGAAGGSSKFVELPSDVKNKVQAGEYLLKLGIPYGSEEYDKIWAEKIEPLKLPLR